MDILNSTGQAKGITGKCKKRGRNERKCKRYFNKGQREKNKLRRLAKHRQLHPNDNVAVSAFNRANKMLPGERAWKKKGGV